MPCPSAPSVTAASPVRTPARARERRVELRDGGDEVERRADGALGVVLVRDRRAPDGHHRVADELLDRAAVALDQRGGRSRSSAESSSRVSSASRSSEARREADQVGEEDGDEPPLGRGGRGRPAARRRRVGARAAHRTRRRTAPRQPPGGRSGRRATSAAPQLGQNFALGAVLGAAAAQVTRSPPPERARRRRPLEPRRRLEPLEDLARLGEQPLRRVAVAEQLGLLELRDGEPERDRRARGNVAAAAARPAASPLQTGPEAVGLRLEVRRP